MKNSEESRQLFLMHFKYLWEEDDPKNIFFPFFPFQKVEILEGVKPSLMNTLTDSILFF